MNSSFEYLTNTNYNGLLRPEVLTMLLLCADGTVLKLILYTFDGRAWDGFIWLRIGTNSGVL
jgi:hypothetical protein